MIAPTTAGDAVATEGAIAERQHAAKRIMNGAAPPQATTPSREAVVSARRTITDKCAVANRQRSDIRESPAYSWQSRHI